MEIVIETDHRFFLNKSTLPYAGFGCFARVPIKKNDYLEIIGVKVERDTPFSRFADEYKFADGTLDKFKYLIIPLGYAGYVNEANRTEDVNCTIAHLTPEVPNRNPSADRVVFLMLRDIEANEELLATYNRPDVEVYAKIIQKS